MCTMTGDTGMCTMTDVQIFTGTGFIIDKIGKSRLATGHHRSILTKSSNVEFSIKRHQFTPHPNTIGFTWVVPHNQQMPVLEEQYPAGENQDPRVPLEYMSGNSILITYQYVKRFCVDSNSSNYFTRTYVMNK